MNDTGNAGVQTGGQHFLRSTNVDQVEFVGISIFTRQMHNDRHVVQRLLQGLLVEYVSMMNVDAELLQVLDFRYRIQ
jgi:hypothetical protein